MTYDPKIDTLNVTFKEGVSIAESDELLHAALDSFCQELKIKLQVVIRLPMLREARDSLDKFMQRR